MSRKRDWICGKDSISLRTLLCNKLKVQIKKEFSFYGNIKFQEKVKQQFKRIFLSIKMFTFSIISMPFLPSVQCTCNPFLKNSLRTHSDICIKLTRIIVFQDFGSP